MRAALAIAGTSVRRLLRDRSNLFFVFVFPLLLVLLLGSAFGGSFDARIGVVGGDDGGLGQELADRVADLDGVTVEAFDDDGGLRVDVARGNLAAGLVIPDDYDERLRAGEEVEVEYVAGPAASGQLLRASVVAAVAGQANLVRAALVAADATGVAVDAALDAATAASEAVPGVDVTVTEAGESTFAEFEGLGQFDLVTHQQTLLFTFLTSLTAAAALIQSRRLGVTRRMLAAPVSTRTILAGEALGRFGVALLQAVYIVVGTTLMFGSSWGTPAGWVPLVTLFALVSSLAGLLIGAAFSNDAQAAGIGVLLGLALAAVGGCMLPLELFSDTMQRVAHVTPHAWAMDGFAELVRRDGGLVDILPELGALSGFALVLLVLASWRLRVALTVRS